MCEGQAGEGGIQRDVVQWASGNPDLGVRRGVRPRTTLAFFLFPTRLAPLPRPIQPPAPLATHTSDSWC